MTLQYCKIRWPDVPVEFRRSYVRFQSVEQDIVLHDRNEMAFLGSAG
jgi:hypothetical protein